MLIIGAWTYRRILYGFLLVLVSLAPLIIILATPMNTGDLAISNINGSWLPSDWSCGLGDIVIFFSLIAMAQWGACAWETAAVYGPEYKNLKSDVPKALLTFGLICIMLYVSTLFRMFVL